MFHLYLSSREWNTTRAFIIRTSAEKTSTSKGTIGQIFRINPNLVYVLYVQTKKGVLIRFNRKSILNQFTHQNKPSAPDNRNKSPGRTSLVIINNETSSPCPSLSEVRPACHFHVLCTKVFESYPEERVLRSMGDPPQSRLQLERISFLLYCVHFRFSIYKEPHDLLSCFLELSGQRYSNMHVLVHV